MSRAIPSLTPHRSRLRALSLSLLLCLSCAAHTQSRPLHQHPHPRPKPAQPAPFPVSSPDPIYTPDPVLIASSIALILGGGALGWLLHDRLRRQPLLTANRFLQSDLTRQTVTAESLRHDLDRLTRELEKARSKTSAAEDRYATLLTETRQAAVNRGEARLQTAAERRQRQSEHELREAEQDLSDPANQLRCVQDATVFPRSLLNREEAIVFRAALNAIRDANAASPSRKLSLGVQVSMGEFLGTPKPGSESDNKAHSSINCKRSDLLIYTRSTFRPVLVIEHQGPAHDQGNARGRDAVKRAALEGAGVPLLETTSLHADTLQKQIKDKLTACLT